MSELKNRKGLIITIFMISLIVTFITYSSKAHTCKATDFQKVNPVMKSYQAFSKAEACKKATIMCSYYSSNPKKCAAID
jgi:hypothetical protein